MRELGIVAAIGALMTALPAKAEVYQCRSDAGSERAIEVTGDRFAMAVGSRIKPLCGAGGGVCKALDGGGFVYTDAENGEMLTFFAHAKRFEYYDGFADTTIEFACKPADAATRALFGKA